MKKGEKGIQILAPMIGYRRRRDAAEQEPNTSQDAKPAPMLIGFRAVYVFDLGQTEGADLPEFDHNITGEVGAHRDRMIAFLAAQNIKLEFNEKIAPALGRQLRRQDRLASRPVEGRGVHHACSRDGA